MELIFTKLSEKGQIEIPENIREQLNLETGTQFAVFVDNNTVILKKVLTPYNQDFETLLKRSHIKAAQAGLKEKDIEYAIKNVRKSNNESSN